MPLLFKGKNKVTSPYGNRVINGSANNHKGIDVVGIENTDVLCVVSGVVQTSTIITDKNNLTWQWGNYVKIKGNDNQYYFYCHLASRNVSVGQHVSVGDKIGVMGNTGYSFGAHTHFEVRTGNNSNTTINPSDILGISNEIGIYENNNLNSSENFKFNGIDVSKYQGVIDWGKIKNNGYNYAFIRLGWCNYNGTITEGFDPYFETNMKNAINAGINVGIYVYSYANTCDAARQCANVVLSYAKKYKLTMPIAWDYEDSKTYAPLGKQANTNVCKAFLDEIQKNNYYAILYTYTSFINSYLDNSQLKEYDKWIADYRGYCGYSDKYGIWQYSSDGTVDGIQGRVDMNYIYKDYPLIIKNAGLNQLKEEDNMETLINKSLKVNLVDGKLKCQAFSEHDVDKTVYFGDTDYIPIGIYPCTEKESNIDKDGFAWCKFKYTDGNIYWCIYNINDNRAEIIDTPTEDSNKPIVEIPTNPSVDASDIDDLIKRFKEVCEEIVAVTTQKDSLNEELKIERENNAQLKAELSVVKAEMNILKNKLIAVAEAIK